MALMKCIHARCDELSTSCPCGYCDDIHCKEFCVRSCDCTLQIASPETIRWSRLGLNYPTAEHGGRTSIVDFLDALVAIDDRLEKYEPVKKGAWRKQSVEEHVGHAVAHIMEGEEDMTAAALRALMALQIYLTTKEK